MPRQSRIDAPGALHHIIARGIERRRIFRTKKDYLDFLDRLSSLLDSTGTRCYAWSLIPNHFHLLLKTGSVPIATLMRRLLTGYAVSFNLRHCRHGHVFQNRYKSILCQEETYLKELVRYIHLNPLRAGLVADLQALGRFTYSGHHILIGKKENDWQGVEPVLRLFGNKLNSCRKRYLQYIEDGVGQGRRSELIGGGLIRSLGGWSVAKSLGKDLVLRKGDERILGDSDFVDEILKESEESYLKRQEYQVKGIGQEQLQQAVAKIFEISVEDVMRPGKERWRVRARSLFCYWAVLELGISMTAMAKEIGLSVAAISKAVQRGEQYADQAGYSLDKELNV